jgi:hypothetical protein
MWELTHNLAIILKSADLIISLRALYKFAKASGDYGARFSES